MTDRARARIDEVRAALDRVTDPELDESVVELGFVTGIEVAKDGGVSVDFRLPTYWCAANFSYLMAADMRDAVLSVPWVTGAKIRLDEHMFVGEINDGIAHGKDFAEAFPTEASDDLASIRLHFGLKSLERRQEALLRHMLSLGHDPAAMLDLDICGLERLTLDDDGVGLRTRYLARRALTNGQPRAFVTRAGEPIMPETLHVYLRHIRRVGLNAEFNGALCRGLLAARYATPPTLPPEPGLADFVRQAKAAAPRDTRTQRR